MGLSFTSRMRARVSDAALYGHSRSRERAVRVALEQFMRRLPLPTVLLRRNLRLAYRNQAGAESLCSMATGAVGGTVYQIKGANSA